MGVTDPEEARTFDEVIVGLQRFHILEISSLILARASASYASFISS